MIKDIGKALCKMRRNKEENIIEKISEREIQSPECCMCGDHGLTFELFGCKVCKNKSQHRYCSIEYPKADSYEICNWCLSQKNDNKFDNKAHNSNSSSFSPKMEDDQTKIKGRRCGGGDDRMQNSPKGEKNKGLATMKLKLINNKAIKKLKSTSPPRPPVSRKRIDVEGSDVKEKLRRTRSEGALQRSNSTIIRKHVFKNKVRRYKLLDEVSC
ncbi:hypothetical protein LIER_42622 [Lithospermum erythrorhizon]|uniref:PHD-type zinc finger plants domain-containing protein n=1 Tax=Lithospermum erythrorhizon TaxID=34254 RepID=A0AAV3NPX7_LITER